MNSSCKVETRPKGWSALFRSWYFWKPALGFAGGVAVGLWFYYYGGGPQSSNMTNDPVSSALFFGLLGIFIVKRPCCGGCR